MKPEALAAPAASPDDAAFTALYEREFAYVWHSLRRLGVAARDLPDVTHDVFVTVYRRMHTYDPARPVRPWLFGVAFRVASDHRGLARNAREQVTERVAERPDDARSAEDQLSDAEERALVREALDDLDLDRRAVLVAHDIDEQPVAEMARALDLPHPTLYSRLRSARELFVAALRRARARRGDR